MDIEAFEEAIAKGLKMTNDVCLDGEGYGHITSHGDFHGIEIIRASASGRNAEKEFGFCGQRFFIGEEVHNYTGPELKEELHRRLVLGEPPLPGSHGENPTDRAGQGS